MTRRSARHSKTLVYQYLPSRYGMNPDDLRKADAIEVVVGQGAKPGGGGMLLGQKITDRVAEMRTCQGHRPALACRHPDWTGPDDLEIKILELREITDWEKPIYVKVGGARPYYDTALAVKAGADVVVLDGMQGGTAATQDVFIEHVGMPTLACIRPGGAGAAGSGHAPQGAADRLGRHPQRRRRGQGAGAGRRCGVDRHGGAGGAGRQRPALGRNTRRSAPPPAPMTTGTRAATRPASPRRTPSWRRGSTRSRRAAAANYLAVLTLEAQTIARACGKSHVHNLEPEDLCALTVEAAAMAGVPLAGTDWIRARAGQGIEHAAPDRKNTTVDDRRDTTDDTRPCQAFAERRHQVLHDLLHRPVRRAARQAGAGAGDRHDAAPTARALPASPPGST
jgi:methylamine---glutamate N-methyltransferase subunit C